MSNTGLPPLRDIACSLFCIVLSAAMILYLMRGLVAGALVPWVFAVAFFGIILLCGIWLGRVLFPARWRRCSGSQLVKRMVEIESVGR